MYVKFYIYYQFCAELNSILPEVTDTTSGTIVVFLKRVVWYFEEGGMVL